MAKVEGGPRNLAQALERVDLCLAFKEAQQASINAFLKAIEPTPIISRVLERFSHIIFARRKNLGAQ